MNATDLQVVDLLDSAGPTTATRLAELTGLTPGAIAQLLSRLEGAGLVRRERDPSDARRAVARALPEADEAREIGPLVASIGEAWAQMAADYDEEQLALLLDFVRRANAVSREELYRLREAPTAGEGFFAPLGDQHSGRLLYTSHSAWVSRLVLHAGARDELYRGRFAGPLPRVTVEGGRRSR
jgi:DNA-binding MarR family transcriptional regulator